MLGSIVFYRLTDKDAGQINRRRRHATHHLDEHRKNAAGVQLHYGDEVVAGEVFPMIITAADRVGSVVLDYTVDGQVMLNGSDTLWVRDVRQGRDAGQFSATPF